MSTVNAEAYVINDDGTKTAIPVNFVDAKQNTPSSGNVASECAASFKRGFSRGSAEARGGAGGYGGATNPAGTSGSAPYVNACGYAPQSPFTTVDATTAAPKRSLHLGRRVAGLAIAAIGVPLLILPGPGLALIGLGLLMVVMP